jgi:hypothetical protein
MLKPKRTADTTTATRPPPRSLGLHGPGRSTRARMLAPPHGEARPWTRKAPPGAAPGVRISTGWRAHVPRAHVVAEAKQRQRCSREGPCSDTPHGRHLGCASQPGRNHAACIAACGAPHQPRRKQPAVADAAATARRAAAGLSRRSRERRSRLRAVARGVGRG